MIIYNVSKQDLEQALVEVNKQYAGNIKFKRIDPITKAGRTWRVTLTVVSSKGKGHRLSVNCVFGPERRLHAACWHVHGHFFDSLPAQAVIVAGKIKTYPYAEWHDSNIGSQMFPMLYSEACECNIC